PRSSKFKMTFEHSSSSLGRQCQMVSAENNTSGPALFLNVKMTSVHISSGLVLHQMTSDHNRSELGIQDHSNEPSSSKLENNNDQAPNASFQEDEFINPFCTRVQEIGESSSRNIDNTDVHSFQPQSHDYRWTRDHPLEQVRGNPTMPVQTRRQLATDPEMYELHQFRRLKVGTSDKNHLSKMIYKAKVVMEEKKDEDQTIFATKHDLLLKVMLRKRVLILKNHLHQLLAWKQFGFSLPTQHPQKTVFSNFSDESKMAFLNGPLKEEVYVAHPEGYVDPDPPEKVYLTKESFVWIKQAPKLPKGFIDPDHPEKVYLLRKAWYGKLDADHARCLDTQKSTSGGIQFLGDKLVSWMSKKQNCTAMSSAEAEYVALSASCAQVMWMRTQLQDYGFNYNKIPLTEYQLADMFTKALPEDRFKYLVRRIGMRCLTPAELEVLTNESA
ncbi:hypothetical protein Tco_0548321, partial [Tanacetum coccineum]